MNIKAISSAIIILATSCQGNNKATDTKPIAPEANGLIIPNEVDNIVAFEMSDVTYSDELSATNQEISERVTAHNKFSFKLYQALVSKEQENNLTFSPLSIQTAFSLLYPSTSLELESAKEMAAALQFSTDQEAFEYSMKGLLVGLKDDFNAELPKEQKLKWALVNQIWVDENFDVQEKYLTTIKKTYNANVGKLPIRANPEKSRGAINTIIAANTNNLIKDLLPDGSLNRDTAAILTNSVYMLADWLIPFEKEATYSEKFTQIDGESIDTPMMHMIKNLDYITTESWHAVSLDYVGNKIAMAFVLPHENNNFSEFETSFSQDDYENLVRNLNGTNIDLTLPKFKLEWGSKSLMQSLNSLGMKKVFIGDANHFPKLLEQNGEPLTQSLWIDNVYHQCKVIVDEKGTEAAAATSISVSIESAPADPENPIEFKVDRPAMFFIYQKSTGALLFIGRLTKL